MPTLAQAADYGPTLMEALTAHPVVVAHLSTLAGVAAAVQMLTAGTMRLLIDPEDEPHRAVPQAIAGIYTVALVLAGWLLGLLAGDLMLLLVSALGAWWVSMGVHETLRTVIRRRLRPRINRVKPPVAALALALVLPLGVAGCEVTRAVPAGAAYESDLARVQVEVSEAARNYQTAAIVLANAIDDGLIRGDAARIVRAANADYRARLADARAEARRDGGSPTEARRLLSLAGAAAGVLSREAARLGGVPRAAEDPLARPAPTTAPQTLLPTE